MLELLVGSLGWVGRKWQRTQVFLPGKSHGQRSLAGYSPWGCKELDTTKHTYATFTSLPYLHVYSLIPPFLSNLCPYLRKILFPQPYYKDVGSDGKESACNAGDLGSIPGLGKSPGGGHGNSLLLEDSCLAGYSP